MGRLSLLKLNLKRRDGAGVVVPELLGNMPTPADPGQGSGPCRLR